MRFLDLFAGIGGFRKGLEDVGHRCMGFCERDKYAIASYTSMHLITEEQRQYLLTLDKYHRLEEIQKEKYRNGDWFIADIQSVNASNIPRVDLWTFGAPCQDFSMVSGFRSGLRGDRSSLVREVFRILREMDEEDRPEWLLYENVKGMLSSNKGHDFLEILLALDELGYDCEWQMLNSKHFGVPQSRERVYTIGHLRRYGRHQILPITGSDREGTDQKLDDRHDRFIIDKSLEARVLDVANCITAREDRNLSARGREGTLVCDVLPNADREDIGHIWYPQKNSYISIRRLTPRECFRLQGWSDQYIDRAQMVCSDAQLYKQAGNGVTVNVVRVIGELLRRTEQ